MTLYFNPEKHTYTIGNSPNSLLSVTSVLPDIPDFLLCKQAFIEKTLLGSRVHECCDTINLFYKENKGVIPNKDYYQGNSTQDADIPYINAYKQFLVDRHPVIQVSEFRTYHRKLMYAGTIDLVAWIDGKLWIIDLKTSAQIAPYAKLQLAAYLRMWNEQADKQFRTFRRAVVHLLPNGEYKFIPYTVSSLGDDFDIFMCKLRSAQWDQENLGQYTYQ